jgi:hypothetical protein
MRETSGILPVKPVSTRTMMGGCAVLFLVDTALFAFSARPHGRWRFVEAHRNRGGK